MKSGAELGRMKRVDAHRFAFELLARRAFPGRGFVRAGDAPRALYAGSFAVHARNRLERLGLETGMADAGLEAFEVSVRSETRRILLCHLLWARFARALEVASGGHGGRRHGGERAPAHPPAAGHVRHLPGAGQ